MTREGALGVFTLSVVWAAGAFAAGGAENDGWVPLLDERTIERWTIQGESRADFRYADGVVVGRPVGRDPKNSFLCSPREYQDFELRFAFRITPKDLNSGVQFRSRVREDGIVAGPQLELELSGRADASFRMRYLVPILLRFTDIPWSPRYKAAGGVYGESLETGWIYPGVAGGDAEAFEEQGERLTKVDDWNEVRLEVVGPRIRSWLAGEARADFEYADVDQPGLICLQVHGGHYEDPSQYRIEWRDLEIRER